MTYGSSGIQATNLLYLRNSQASIDANDTWFYIYNDPVKNLAVISSWKWPAGVTFTTAEADELDEIAGNIPMYTEEAYASFGS